MIHATSLAVRDAEIIQMNHIFSFEQKPMGYALACNVVKTNVSYLFEFIVLKYKAHLA